MSLPRPTHVPVSTYRLQLSPGLTFADAARLAPYLQRLGVSDCYCSPILAARAGSTHGYDVTDHSSVNPAIGGLEGFDAFSAALQAHGLGLLVDIVPNHMSTDPLANRWWRSVLENGPASPFEAFFDIDWAPVKFELNGKVLLPVLGDQYGVTLESGQLQIETRGGEFHLRYFDVDLPLNPRELRQLLRHDVDALADALGREHPDFVELQSILFQLDHLPVYTDTREDMVTSRGREKGVARQRLEHLLDASPAVRRHVEATVRCFNGVAGDARSFDLLHGLLEGQPYRLSSWRTAMHEINYRRFFDINELAGVRVEHPEVFEATHELLARLARRGQIQGFRVDHVDGLFDPATYLNRLSVLGGERQVYVITEKILSEAEGLRTDWQTHGTTGYDFMNDVNGLFVDARHVHDFRKLYSRFIGSAQTFADVVYDGKKAVIATSMASELNVLAHELNRISERNRRFRDFTLDSLQEALREVVACFPTYRTYLTADGWTSFDEHAIQTAVAGALVRNPAMEPSIFDFVRQMLLPVPGSSGPDDEYRRRVRFAMKFQQYTGPVQAKGTEDTAFYRDVPLLSLNEVGGRPARFGVTVEEFHRANVARLRDWPLTMLATSTHDSKRGEDARARLDVLSELPREWRTAVARWSHANASAKTMVRDAPAPSRGDEYLFYQALLGAWPAGAVQASDVFVERMRRFLLKAVREAKVHTSWINPSREYDEAVDHFVARILSGQSARMFLRLFVPFAGRIARLGAINSLSQLLLKIGSPGVCDFYWGSELWDLALVDPDNRQPVDFDCRAEWLRDLDPLLAASGDTDRTDRVGEMLTHWEDGRIKLYATAAALCLRRRWPDVFLEGSYLPLPAAGDRADHLVAFERRLDARSIIVLAPRLVASLYGTRGPSLAGGSDLWKDTRVQLAADGRLSSYRNLLTGEVVPVHAGAELRAADALGVVPAALLVSDDVIGTNEEAMEAPAA